MGALERLAEAQISSNLADDSLKLSDVDYLRASGWAAQINPDGLMLYRLKYANDHREYAQTLRRVYSLAVGKAFRMRLTISHQDLHELAENTLRHWVAPICPSCLGRGTKSAQMRQCSPTRNAVTAKARDTCRWNEPLKAISSWLSGWRLNWIRLWRFHRFSQKRD